MRVAGVNTGEPRVCPAPHQPPVPRSPRASGLRSHDTVVLPERAIIRSGLNSTPGSFVANTQVEFFGVPRQRAGAAALEVQAETLGQLLTILTLRVPPLRELLDGDGRLHKSFVASLNG